MRIKPGEALIYEPVAQYDSAQRRFVPLPIDLGKETDVVFLVLFGTGLRYYQNISGVSVRIGGVEAPVYFAGAQGYFAGMDQINVRLERSLIGKGDVEVELTVDNRRANPVWIKIL